MGAKAFAASADQFENFLSRLNALQPSSLCAAQDRFRSQFGNPSAPGQAHALFALWAFYDQSVRQNQDRIVNALFEGLAEEQSRILMDALESQGTADLTVVRQKAPEAWRRVEQWSRCGYNIEEEVTEVVLDPDPRFLRNLTDHLRPELRDYVELFLHQSPYHLEYDLGLAIPWDALRARIGRWERFRAAHSDSPELMAHIDRQIRSMFELYLCGLDNSPAFESGLLNAELRQSYVRFLNLNRESRNYSLIKTAVTILSKDKWKCSFDLIQLYKAHGYATELLERECN